MFNINNFNASLRNAQVSMTQDMDNYTSLAKFMEQAFEWDIMSYQFYPYYWGNRDSWVKNYQYNDTDDPIFRSFNQAGMARVLVTVRPGFEKAVKLYLSTGLLWNGGEVPVIGNDLYLGIDAELRPRNPKKDGPAWLTRVPTALTILQADSIGLTVEDALPCNCDDILDFPKGTVIPCNDDPGGEVLEKKPSAVLGVVLPENKD